MQRYYVSAFTAFLIWGFMPLIVRHLQGYPIGLILYFRIVLAIFLLIFAGIFILPERWRETCKQFQQSSKIEKQKIIGITVFSSFILMLNWTVYIYVVNYVDTQSSAFAYILCPILTAIFGFLILNEKLLKHQWLAISLCIVSCGMMATGTLRTFLYSLLVGSIYALYLVIQRFTKDYDKIVLLTLQLFLAAICILPFYSFIQAHEPAELDSRFFGLALVLSLFFTVIPLFLNLYALKNLPSATVGVFMYMNPLTGFMLAFFYFGEKTTDLQILAYLLIFVAVLLYNLPLSKKAT